MHFSGSICIKLDFQYKLDFLNNFCPFVDGTVGTQRMSLCWEAISHSPNRYLLV
jgi:hypothetical protein